MKKFDVIVVGSGASGMMASISAAQAGASVCLVEKNKKVGKKLLMTGGGRCNVTNNAPVEEIMNHIIGNGKFLYSAFTQFSNQDIIRFFQDNGVPLKEEDHGRMFPTTDKSKTIVEALFHKLQSLGVEFLPNAAVQKLLIENSMIQGVSTESELIYAPCVVLSTGGRAYPSTGSTGDGYRLAKSAGHTITTLFATESALISSEPFVLEKTLQGISLREVALSVLDENGKVVVRHQHDLLFTHFGLSGPAALRCSSFVNAALQKGSDSVNVSLDCFPEKSLVELLSQLTKLADGKNLRNAFSSVMQERLLLFFFKKANLDEQMPAKELTTAQIEQLASLMKDFRIKIDKTFPIEKSFVTGGGVNLKEINPKTMESKRCGGLFMSGELLDIHGYTGGYNVTCAFVTGFVAGKNAAQIASYFDY